MLLDKLLFDELDLALIKKKIFTRKQIIGMNIYRFLFVPRTKCTYCKKKYLKEMAELSFQITGLFIPNV